MEQNIFLHQIGVFTNTTLVSILNPTIIYAEPLHAF